MFPTVYFPLIQVTQLKTGAATGNADIEQYAYDNPTGLLVNQKVIKQNTGQTLEFQHPDRLGTKLVTNNQSNTSFELSTLPFGTTMPSESSGFSNQVFTSYDRSTVANLDYAVNRTYSPTQGRFTTPDPIGMASAVRVDPQTNNLYAYARNNPIDFVDPSGLNIDSPGTTFVSGTLWRIWYGNKIDGFNLVASFFISHGGQAGGADSGTEGTSGDDVPPRSGPCDLQTPTFDQLAQANPAALALLKNTYGDQARINYAAMGPYNQAVFLNTVAAVSAQGVNLESAKFVDFYRGNKANANAFGLYLSGITLRNLDDAGLEERTIAGFDAGRRSPGKIKEGSVEASPDGNDVVAFDVDLFNPNANLFKHLEEVDFNRRNNTTTHPADVVRALNRRGIHTGVTCR